MAPAAPPRVPGEVEAILATLWKRGHAAFLVGGGVRDALLGRRETDWDIGTDARPENLLELFPSGRYENRFGTVTVNGVEVTTFRRDHRYGDHRRPDSVTFSDSIEQDLARRDFTVNAIAYGRVGGDRETESHWVDPHGGLGDLDGRLLRAVGDAETRFDEDALRLLRAARLAAQLDFQVEQRTLAAMRVTAPLARFVSSERLGDELRKMIAADPPSRALAMLADTGILDHVLPEIASQRGLAQLKIAGHDLWDHTLATLDAAARIDPPNQRLRTAALMHDVGKPTTAAEGRFLGHDREGALLADAILSRLAFPRREVEPIAALVRGHMFQYQPKWSDAAVRRFIRRIGRDLLFDQLNLRRADNVGSGLAPDAGQLDDLERRARAELEARAPLSLAELAVNGDDLIAELSIDPGPGVGRLLDYLLERVVRDPAHNTRPNLLAEAAAWLERNASAG